jgi:hypothetical protein
MKKTILLLTILLIPILSTAANPGHTAAQISPGTFNTGGAFTFPEQLSIGGNFIVNTDNFFINTTSGNIGIGTNNPTSKLYVEGDITVNSTSDVCIEGGVCLSTRGTIGGSGTTNTIPLWTGASTLGNSQITQTATTITINRTLNIQNGNFLINTDSFFINATNSRVGIRTTNPTAALEIDGGIRLNTEDARPACNANQRGTMWYERSTSGTDDFLYACMRNSAENYNWILVARGG